MAGVLTGFISLILGIAGVRRSADRAGRIIGIIGIILSSLAMLVGITCGALLLNSLSTIHD
ncbi:MAG TPA: hypothetical protein VHQ47_18625 [Phycisphaerae bacterium]|nr:hypothetical protein [Phycisphaerae bacterium]